MAWTGLLWGKRGRVGGSAAGGVGRAVGGTFALVEGVGEDAEGTGEIGAADAVEDGAADFVGLEHAGAGEQGEVPGDDGDIDGGAFGDFADGARAATLGDAGDEGGAGGVGKGLEEGGVEEGVEWPATGSGVPGGSGDASIACLRHRASISTRGGGSSTHDQTHLRTPPAGLEPATTDLEDRSAIQLRHGGRWGSLCGASGRPGGEREGGVSV